MLKRVCKYFYYDIFLSLFKLPDNFQRYVCVCVCGVLLGTVCSHVCMCVQLKQEVILTRIVQSCASH